MHMTSSKKRTLINEISEDSRSVQLHCWVHNCRTQGNLVFLDLRDASGFVQAVARPQNLSEDEFTLAKDLVRETTVIVEGSNLELPPCEAIEPPLGDKEFKTVFDSLQNHFLKCRDHVNEANKQAANRAEAA